MQIRSIPLFAFVFASLQFACGEEFRVGSAAELLRVNKQLNPGDSVVLADGMWRDQETVFRGKGTAGQPITFRAETPGKVIFTGQSSLDIDGEHLVIAGLSVHQIEAAKEAVVMRGHHCRFTESSVVDSDCKFFLRLFGSDHRVDHCYFAEKSTGSPTMQIEVEETPNRHRIDHNHFGPRAPLGRNGGETIRLGYSHQSMLPSRTLVEKNLFERCDGELEIISNKSCENIYRSNTFLECAGMFTLRHGNRCRVEGNFFLGRGKKGSGGIRVIGEDHVIVNNYIDGVTQGGFWVTAGIPDSPLVGYFQAKNCLIAFNTVVNSRGPCIDVDAGLRSSGRTLAPAGITVANNIFAGLPDEPIIKGRETGGYRWIGNLGSTGANQVSYIRPVDLNPSGGADNVWRPASDSPARGAAEGDFPQVATDIDGQPRNGRKDAGCDQISEAPVVDRPLGISDVGPAWRRTRPAQSETPIDAATK